MIEQLDVVLQALMRAFAERLTDDRALERVHANRRARRAMLGVLLEEMDLTGAAIVHAHEPAHHVVGVEDRPCDRMALDPEIRLEGAQRAWGGVPPPRRAVFVQYEKE